MKLGFVEDFTSDIALDKEIILNSKTGISLNSGVHPSITLDNLLHFLPFPKYSYKSYDSEKEYNNFSESRNNDDIVIVEGKYYQCIKDGTIGEEPQTSENWIETNPESQLLKSWIESVKNRIYSDLRLSKRLINSQKLYEIGKREYQLPNDFSAWVFESKGSDYVSIRINEIALQKIDDVIEVNEDESEIEESNLNEENSNSVDLFVINQNRLVDTIKLHPENGKFKFEKVDYSFSGIGQWIFAINSCKVLTNHGYIDPHKYDGFVCYTATGIGETPETAKWNFGNSGNGLGFNVTVSLESKNYIENNFYNLESLIKSTFELMTLQMFLHNSNNRSNRNEKIQLNTDLLMLETKDGNSNTVASRYLNELKQAKKIINKTFDTQIGSNDDFEVETSSI